LPQVEPARVKIEAAPREPFAVGAPSNALLAFADGAPAARTRTLVFIGKRTDPP